MIVFLHMSWSSKINCIFVEAQTFVKVNGTDIAQPVTSPSLHDLQVYGIVVTIILCFIVFGGVKIINRVAPAFLLPVLFSLFCIFIGIFLARENKPTGKFHFSLLLIIIIIMIIIIVITTVIVMTMNNFFALSHDFGICLGYLMSFMCSHTWNRWNHWLESGIFQR